MSDILYQQAKSIAAQLTPQEMIKLAGWLEAAAEFRPQQAEQAPTLLKDLYGSWSDVQVSDQDIEEIRRESLSNFPSEDI
jgi:hypothetical protein